MLASITYARLSAIVDRLDSADPECKFHVKNLRTLLLFIPALTTEQEVGLTLRLLKLDRKVRGDDR